MLDEHKTTFVFTDTEPDRFQGKDVEFQDEGRGKVTQETVDSIFIVSRFFTGWMFKADYYDLLGVAE
jgi:hypothetical protein